MVARQKEVAAAVEPTNSRRQLSRLQFGAMMVAVGLANTRPGSNARKKTPAIVAKTDK